MGTGRDYRTLALIAWTTALIVGLTAPLVCHAAAADWKPKQNVEIVVPTSPGAGLDTFARLIQRLLTGNKLIEVPATVVNKPGGGGALGAAYLTQNPGDGHYLMMANPPLMATHIMGRNPLNYTDTTPLAILTVEATVFAVRADSPLKTAKDLADRLKAGPASITMAFANAVGNHNHIALAQVVKGVGANVKNMKVVIFSGSGEATTALLGGHVDVVNSSPSALLGRFETGAIRILAVTAEQRLGGPFSAIPTWKELGINAVTTGWRAVVGPKGMSEEQIRYWDGVFARMVQLPEWKQYLEKGQVENAYLNARDAGKRLDAEFKELSVVLRELGLAK